HGGKTAARAAVSHSPEPFSNILLSLSEDAAVVFLMWFATRHAYAAAGIAVAGLALIAIMIRAVVRAMSSFFGRAEATLPKRPPSAPCAAPAAPPAVPVAFPPRPFAMLPAMPFTSGRKTGFEVVPVIVNGMPPLALLLPPNEPSAEVIVPMPPASFADILQLSWPAALTFAVPVTVPI